MKQLLITIAAAVLVGCGDSQQSAPAPETEPTEPLAEVAKPEPPTAKAPDIDIHEAAKKGDIEAIKQHLAAGANVNAEVRYKGTPLHIVAYAGDIKIAKLLISNGADINSESSGSTPLHRAACGGKVRMINLLIARGADVNKKEVYGGMTPLDSAIFTSQKNAIEILLLHGGKSGADDSIHLAAQLGDCEAIKKHLKEGVDVNAKNKEYSDGTALHAVAEYANRYNHIEIVSILLAAGANINAQNLQGLTPLDCSINPKISDLFRKHGGKTAEELKAEGK